MTLQPVALQATLDAMRERALRLEQEASALRSDLDEMAVLLSWQTTRTVAPDTLRKIVVSEAEVADYRRMVGAQFPDAVLRLVLKAHKAATRLKQSVRPTEREAAIRAIIDTLNQAATALGLTIPTELEAMIGD